ncbi:hypothetical protein GCM10018962_60260 [Dactylosporangium matsuzakiense]|uniref:Uncharacterized protein n=1 Tax=Dactylosporangium matsuzakiense TaxID=53360 RepID=A0A9W6NRF3_9ACTN|nr:hypothetical protein GCM10017581_082740 [Dactylosporangium matsuzakiense]
MSKLPRSSRLVSPVDTGASGEHRITRTPDDTRPRCRCAGHVPGAAASGRYRTGADRPGRRSRWVTTARALDARSGDRECRA